MIDEGKLSAFIGQMLEDLGGASSIAMVRLGGSLGLYEALHTSGPMTSGQLARAANVNERYLREWLSHQAASNYLAYDAKTEKFSLPPEQAMVFVNQDSPVYMMGAFDLMAALLDNQPKVQAAFKSGKGVAWGDQAGGGDAFFGNHRAAEQLAAGDDDVVGGVDADDGAHLWLLAFACGQGLRPQGGGVHYSANVLRPRPEGRRLPLYFAA